VISQQSEELFQQIICLYEQTRLPWEVLQPVSACLQDFGEKKFRKLLQKSPTIWLPELQQRFEKWSDYTSTRQDSWERRVRVFAQWYSAGPSPVMKMPSIVQPSIFPITWLSPEYPECLRQIDDPPPVLYANHPWKEWVWPQRRLAIIGSRNMSEYGRQATQEITRDLVELYQVGVVSGGAQGVDICAQQQALHSRGKTIGVLGCGLAQVTSWKQKNLLSHPSALWISEFPPTFSAQNWTFVQRNRLIAGLGQGLLVVEAQEKSGTMITVSYALDQGKPVCVVPQNLWNKNASGITKLANQGATLVESASQVAALIWEMETKQSSSPVSVSPIEQQILQKLQENEGQLSLADLIYSCPDTIEQSQWEAAVRQLEKKQIIGIDLGTVHCQSMIKS
jgi:DNA processing protein